MKKILSFILVICMVMTVAPASVFAQATSFTFKPEQTTYEAGVGETVSVPFQLVPNSNVTIGPMACSVEIPEGLRVTSVTAGKIPVSGDNGVNVANGKVNVFYDVDGGVALTPSDNVLFTVNCTATASGTYTLKTVMDEIYDLNYDLIADSSNVTLQDATITFVSNFVTFDGASTQVKKQTFDNGEFSDGLSIPQKYFPEGSTVDNVIIEGIQENNGGYFTKTVNDGGDLALLIQGKNDVTFSPWHARVETQTPYIVAQYNYKTNSLWNDVHFRFWYDDLTNGEIVPDSTAGKYYDRWQNAGLPLAIKTNAIERSDMSGRIENATALSQYNESKNTIAVTEGDYNDSQWHKYTYIIDALNFRAFLFIDGKYIADFAIVRNENETDTDNTAQVDNYSNDLGSKYIEGIQLFQFRNNKYNSTLNNANGGTKLTYVDDLEVRKMTAEGLQSVIGSDMIVPALLSTEIDTLPTVSNEYKMPITWTTENQDVTINPDGTITLENGKSKVENVTLTAKVLGATKTYLVTIEGEPVEGEEDYTPGIENNSTRVKYQGFDDGEFSDGLRIEKNSSDKVYFPYGTTPDNGTIIEGLSTSEPQGYKAETVKTEDGDLALYMEGNKGGTDGSTNFVPWHARVETQTDYIVAQYNYKTNSVQNDVHFRFWYDDLVGGEMVADGDAGRLLDTWEHGGLPVSIMNNKINREALINDTEKTTEYNSNDNSKTITGNKYHDGNWHKYTYLIDARGFKAYLFIDNEYIMSFTIVRDRNKTADNYKSDIESGTRYIEGIQLFQFRNNRYNSTVDGTSTKKTYVDDLEVRKMTKEQYLSFIKADLGLDTTELSAGDKLPALSNTYKLPVTWTSGNSAVTVENDGTISLAEGVTSVENATVTAKALGVSRTFKVTVTGEEVVYTPGIENNSTLMKKQTFDNGEFSDGLNIPSGYFPSGSTVDNVIIEGISGQGEHTADIKTNEKGNLSLYLRRNVATNGNADQAFVPWHARVETQSDYIVAKFDYKTNSYNNDMHFRFWYDDLVGGEMVPDSELGESAPRIDTWGNGGLPLYLKYNSILRDTPFGGGANSIGTKGNDNFKWISENKYQDGNWHTYTFLIDARGFKAYLFIDNEYIMSFTIVRDRNEEYYNTDTTTNRYIEGIQLFQFRNGRYSEDGPTVKETWVDNLEVRKMTKDQYLSFIKADLGLDSLALTTNDVLPTKTSTYKFPVTWTDNSSDVTIGNDGKITLNNDKTKVEDVALTASYFGITKTYVVSIEKPAKYAEYIFGFDADKAYQMTSENATNAYNVYSQKGVSIKNAIIKHASPVKYYYVGVNADDSGWGKPIQKVTKDEYDAYTGTIKNEYTISYESYASSTGESVSNRYANVGPDGDKRDAVFGVKHFRPLDERNQAIETPSMIHLDTGKTFTAEDNSITVEFDILDYGTNTINFKYCANDGTIKTKTSPAFTNTNKWKTLTFTLTDADFAWTEDTGLGNQKQDFRLEADRETYVSAVRVYVTGVDKELTDSDYTVIELADYQVAVNQNGTVYAKADLTEEEAADAKVYVAIYDEAGDLLDVKISKAVTNGVAQRVTTSSTKSRFEPANYYTVKSFVWTSLLKPLR